MSWYYAGPEAKPVGPVSLEELHALRAGGSVSPDTYVIEHTGQPNESPAWKRFKDVFPSSSVLPPIPLAGPPPPVPLISPVPPAGALPPSAPHPLFPSGSAAPGSRPVFPANPARPDPYYHVKPTNGWCAWGFGIGLIGFFLSFVCGAGLLPALLAFVLCIVGLVQVNRRHEQTGQGLAISGLILSVIALLISLVMFIWLAGPIIRAHGFTVTEQTSNDSE